MAKLKHTYPTWRQAPVRNTFRVATSRFVLAPLIIIALILVGVLFYYYNLYTQIIDARLRGDVFVRSSGIYAAPLNLYSGSGMRMNTLVAHLRAIGYQEGSGAQNTKRGHFLVQGSAVEIHPGSDVGLTGTSSFRDLRVVFGREGNSLQSISDLDSRQKLDQAQVEPELISSVINQEREKRKNIEYKDLPQNLVDAIVSVEDRQFFEHPGINWRGILRALVRDYQSGEFREGGSSVTQQLVKSFFLNPERTPKRKLAEAYMSILLEQRLSKEDIMAMYCNQIYLGQRGGFSINGFGQAARAYFGKDISNLSLAESALLAGIIRSPNYYSPYSNPERALERRNLVLEMMFESEKASRADADAAKRQPLGLTGKASGVDASDAPYFIDYVMRQLETQYPDGEMLRSMRIYTTIDLNLQRAAYQAVAKNMVDIEKLLARRRGGTAGLQAALVALNPKTGEILAMVGGKDYASSQLNRATEAKRQPGSVFKPFVYAAALEESQEGNGPVITPATMFVDEPHTFEFDGKPYEPGNFADKYEMRPITVRDALVNSKNVITVEIAQKIGFQTVARLAERAGLTKIPPYPSMALGVGEATPLQMASAYTIFANQGRRASPISIKRVTAKDGTPVFDSKSETREVLSPQVAYIMTSMMQDVLDRGTGTRVRQMGFTATAAGKTGSSRDGWFAGYTPNLVCVVWVGFDDNSDLGLTGGATAAPIWADFMKIALQARPELGGKFPTPEEGIDTYDIDPMTGDTQSGGSNTRHELFLKGTQPGSQGGGQGRPESSSNPDPDDQQFERMTRPPNRSETDAPRPTPTPKPIDDRLMTGLDDSAIPLPPGARSDARRSRDGSEPEQESAQVQEKERPSFFRKLANAMGFGSKPKNEPVPEPTPWTNGGLGPVTRPSDNEDDNRKRVTPPSPRPTPESSLIRVTPVPTPKPKSKTASKTPDTPKQESLKKASSTSAPIIASRSTPAPTPRPSLIPVPAAVPATVQAAEGPGPRQPGTFVMDVCSVTGLIPVPGVCNTTTRRRFKLGQEPTIRCSSDKHHGR